MSSSAFVEEATEGLGWGQRVVGSINIGCGQAALPVPRPVRSTAPSAGSPGILDRDGAFAEYLTLPVENLFQVPDEIPDESAVFTEPLAGGGPRSGTAARSRRRAGGP